MWEIHAYAILSDDDRIADQAGRMPPAMHNAADWDYFQAELDKGVLSVLGRRSHELAENPNGRKRAVISRAASGLEQRGDAYWWNPSEVAIADMLRALAPDGGRITVPGGQAAFDLFLDYGFDYFHLSRKHGLMLPGGVGVFSAVNDGAQAEACLESAGLTAGETRMLDPDAEVSLTLWRR